jgi:endonuclease-3
VSQYDTAADRQHALSPAETIERLAAAYGRPEPRPHNDPVAELVLTLLSQNTSDTNSGRAFTSLLSAFPTWDAVADAPVEQIEAAIQVGGLAKTKAPRLKAILQAVRQRAPDWDLGFLGEVELEEAREWLRSLPGVGPKTAACVLLFALGRPALPVDTHVHRVAGRLGLIPAKTSAERAHEILERMVAPELMYAWHMTLIKHGRRTCYARNPACPRCVLADVCPSYELLVGEPFLTSGGAPTASS